MLKVGQTVQFFPNEHDHVVQSNGNDGGPVAAVVTRVWSPSCVNLVVFPDAAEPLVRTSIAVREERDELGNSCCWPVAS